MLEVKVILHNANTGESSEIGQLVVYNIGQGAMPGRYQYRVRASWSERTIGQEQKSVDRFSGGFVRDHDRQRDVWELIRKAIESLGL